MILLDPTHVRSASGPSCSMARIQHFTLSNDFDSRYFDTEAVESCGIISGEAGGLRVANNFVSNGVRRELSVQSACIGYICRCSLFFIVFFPICYSISLFEFALFQR